MSPNKIVCIVLHLDLCPRWHPPQKKNLFSSKKVISPFWGHDPVGPPWPSQRAPRVEFFTVPPLFPICWVWFQKKNRGKKSVWLRHTLKRPKTSLHQNTIKFENWWSWPNYLEKYSRIIAILPYLNGFQIRGEISSKIHQRALSMV